MEPKNEMMVSDMREISDVRELSVFRDPEEVVAEATRAAEVLTRVLSKKKKKFMYNGEQFLEFEDWQTIGKFYQLSAGSEDAEPVTVNGVEGAKAKATVIHLPTGRVVSHAVAFCMASEKNWGHKPWFQIASMAQTRACAKAFRNVLSWVVVLAGYRPTPAEEMVDIPIKPPTPPVNPDHMIPDDLAERARASKAVQDFLSPDLDVAVQTDTEIAEILGEDYPGETVAEPAPKPKTKPEGYITNKIATVKTVNLIKFLREKFKYPDAFIAQFLELKERKSLDTLTQAEASELIDHIEHYGSGKL